MSNESGLSSELYLISVRMEVQEVAAVRCVVLPPAKSSVRCCQPSRPTPLLRYQSRYYKLPHSNFPPIPSSLCGRCAGLGPSVPSRIVLYLSALGGWFRRFQTCAARSRHRRLLLRCRWRAINCHAATFSRLSVGSWSQTSGSLGWPHQSPQFHLHVLPRSPERKRPRIQPTRRRWHKLKTDVRRCWNILGANGRLATSGRALGWPMSAVVWGADSIIRY